MTHAEKIKELQFAVLIHRHPGGLPSENNACPLGPLADGRLAALLTAAERAELLLKHTNPLHNFEAASADRCEKCALYFALSAILEGN